MKKILMIVTLLFTANMAQASWWGGLSSGSRAAIVIGSTLLLNNEYQDSEIKHQRDLDRLDTQVRREYQKQAVLENAHQKYSHIAPPRRLEAPRATRCHPQQNKTAKIIFQDERTQIIEMIDGTRVTLHQ